MLTPDQIAAIDLLETEAEDEAEKLAAVSQMQSGAELQCYATVYNWDSGFAVPSAIAHHSACDLGVALTLFWLADGLTWFRNRSELGTSGQDWHSFCSFLSEGILQGRWREGDTPFDPQLGRVELYRLAKEGIPPVFFTPLETVPRPQLS